MSTDDDVVGHKTYVDGHGELVHAPLSRKESEATMTLIEAGDARRREMMPTEQAAIDLLCDAYTRLKELGWNDAIYAPCDGRRYHCIELGSTGIHVGWSEGRDHRWVEGQRDIYPSHHVLFKRIEA